jgi:hypothetical protein
LTSALAQPYVLRYPHGVVGSASGQESWYSSLVVMTAIQRSRRKVAGVLVHIVHISLSSGLYSCHQSTSASVPRASRFSASLRVVLLRSTAYGRRSKPFAVQLSTRYRGRRGSSADRWVAAYELGSADRTSNWLILIILRLAQCGFPRRRKHAARRSKTASSMVESSHRNASCRFPFVPARGLAAGERAEVVIAHALCRHRAVARAYELAWP